MYVVCPDENDLKTRPGLYQKMLHINCKDQSQIVQGLKWECWF